MVETNRNIINYYFLRGLISSGLKTVIKIKLIKGWYRLKKRLLAHHPFLYYKERRKKNDKY